jgi:aldehyde dehydrogenase (NAD+)
LTLSSNEFVESVDKRTFDVVNPATGKKIAAVAEAGPKDVDIAVEVARKAFDTVWGEKTPGFERGKLLIRLADALEAHGDEIAAIEVSVA